MKRFTHALITHLLLLASLQTVAQLNAGSYRPLVHFTPKQHWMNDPNGLVFYNGVYHLFYQHHPYSSVWGPMHWGHATSKDLIHWKHEPIALYPDSIGTIFSGSAVVDKDNTSGLGKNGEIPLVAIFTQHNEAGEKAHRNDFQNQSIAYSPDNGKTWKKYSHNPVLKNPGITDFRDPKVMWYEPSKKWIMTLAVKDHISFYSSKNLKEWTKESDFGETVGAHGGVWECPDLFSLDYNGKPVWVLIVNINPGGPNQGSATQYFPGDFDGKRFIPQSTATKWLDYGPDEYAGITWSNTGKRKIFLGWMSNWLYADKVPTETWRSATTIPRELKLKMVNNDLLVASEPVKELDGYKLKPITISTIPLAKPFHLSEKAGAISFPCMIDLSLDMNQDFSISLTNETGEELLIGYDKTANQYFIDRTKSGQTAFEKHFAARHTAPRFTTDPKIKMTLLIDVASVELFADDGLTVMTEIFFASKPYNELSLESKATTVVERLSYYVLRPAPVSD